MVLTTAAVFLLIILMHQSNDATSASPARKLTQALNRYADRHHAAWIDLRRRLHRHPEPSGEEFETSELIRAHLAQHNVPARIAPRSVGVIGELPIGPQPDDGPVIALRADIDGLRMTDRKATDYASAVDGCAHACGHDVHTTLVLAAAEMLSDFNNNGVTLPSARVRFVFQAAEEICQGAQWMVEDGAMQDVSTILGTHVDPLLPVGHVGISYGALTAQVDEVLISVRGKGGHSARPHNTTDPIAAATSLISLLYQRLPRTVDSREPSVFTIGQIHGGTAPNVIPDHVEMNGTLRSINPAVRRDLIHTIQLICEHYATVSGNAIAVQFRNPLGSVRNSQRPAAAFEQATRTLLGDDAAITLTQPSMGGEDFAVYLDHAPGAQVRLGCASSDNWPLLHSPVFDVDERVIADGARVITLAALNLLT